MSDTDTYILTRKSSHHLLRHILLFQLSYARRDIGGTSWPAVLHTCSSRPRNHVPADVRDACVGAVVQAWTMRRPSTQKSLFATLRYYIAHCRRLILKMIFHRARFQCSRPLQLRNLPDLLLSVCTSCALVIGMLVASTVLQGITEKLLRSICRLPR